AGGCVAARARAAGSGARGARGLSRRRALGPGSGPADPWSSEPRAAGTPRPGARSPSGRTRGRGRGARAEKRVRVEGLTADAVRARLAATVSVDKAGGRA